MATAHDDVEKYNAAYWDDFFRAIGDNGRRTFFKNYATDRLIVWEPIVLNMFGSQEAPPPGGATAWVA
jgi:hypothetical protein